MPYFVIDFSAAKWDFITFSMLNQFVSGDVFVPNVESLHYRSQTDEFYPRLHCYLNFENPIVIEFEGGHRPPKIMTALQIRQTADFFVRQARVKYGDATEMSESLMQKLSESSLL